MKKLRDSFHNINDILLALVIVVLAAGLIIWRIRILLDYPEQIARENARQSESQAETAQDVPASQDTQSTGSAEQQEQTEQQEQDPSTGTPAGEGTAEDHSGSGSAGDTSEADGGAQ